MKSQKSKTPQKPAATPDALSKGKSGKSSEIKEKDLSGVSGGAPIADKWKFLKVD
jgi:hypothetical protein